MNEKRLYLVEPFNECEVVPHVWCAPVTFYFFYKKGAEK